jgi:acid phosphatase family membrane protein YuiD
METYAYIVIPITAAILAQIAKFVIYSFKHGLDWHFLLEYGHMPSSHTSMMSALLVAILVMSDAMRLRMYVGSYGKTINRLVDHLRLSDYSFEDKLKERVGHRPSEILAGILLGVITALVLIRVFELV